MTAAARRASFPEQDEPGARPRNLLSQSLVIGSRRSARGRGAREDGQRTSRSQTCRAHGQPGLAPGYLWRSAGGIAEDMAR